MKVNLFADEKKFPELVNPVQMAWDTKGRLWVAAWRNYPEWTPTEKIGRQAPGLRGHRRRRQGRQVHDLPGRPELPDRIRVLQGRRAGDAGAGLWFVRDTDGDGKADVKRARADGHRLGRHAPHDQRVRASNPAAPSTSARVIPPHAGRDRRRARCGNADAAIYRFEPRTGKFETYVAVRFRQPARPRLRPLGQRHRHRRHGQQHVLRPGVQRPSRLPEQAPAA